MNFMKKSSAACLRLPALLAGLILAPLVGAMSLSTDGGGQVLLFPYYSVEAGNQTLISIVNAAPQGKATRLFFREGRNGRLVAELSIYLAPYDVWTGAVFSLDAGAANLATDDNSCTVPALKTSQTLPVLGNGRRYLPFSNSAYTGGNDDAGPDDLARTREGYVEFIEMAAVTGQRSFEALFPGLGVVPADCPSLVAAWAAGGYWQLDASADLSAPGGGLFGTAYLTDVAEGTLQMYPADAIDGFSGRILHVAPGLGQPTLADANAGASATIGVDVFSDGAPVSLHYPVPAQAIDAVSALFMADRLDNEFVINPQLGAASEWVVGFPTKRFYTDVAAGPAIEPFDQVFPRTGSTAGAPVFLYLDAWTREGRSIECMPPYSYADCIVGVPPPPDVPRLNWVSNVIAFNQPGDLLEPRTRILGSRLGFPINLLNLRDGSDAAEGMVRLSFPADADSTQGRLRADIDGHRLRGVPAQGFWVASYTNRAVTPGVLANYSDAVRHLTRTSEDVGFSAQAGEPRH